MTLNDKLERFLREHPETWIDGRDLAGTVGTYAWRSRVADVRKRFKARGGNIENRQRRFTVRGTKTVLTISEYRYVPQTETVQ
jgi:hypothetical protein